MLGIADLPSGYPIAIVLPASFMAISPPDMSFTEVLCIVFPTWFHVDELYSKDSTESL